jgi:hypothetical protein
MPQRLQLLQFRRVQPRARLRIPPERLAARSRAYESASSREYTVLHTPHSDGSGRDYNPHAPDAMGRGCVKTLLISPTCQQRSRRIEPDWAWSAQSKIGWLGSPPLKGAAAAFSTASVESTYCLASRNSSFGHGAMWPGAWCLIDPAYGHGWLAGRTSAVPASVAKLEDRSCPGQRGQVTWEEPWRPE